VKKADFYLQKIRIGKVIPFIKRGDHILDVGSGEGALFKCLEEKRIPFTGVGFDPEIVHEIHSPNFTIFKEWFPSPKIENRIFDVITALAVLEHIPEDALQKFIRDCNHHLKVGGLILLTVPSPRVDQILNLLIRLRVLDGMEVGQHHGYDTGLTQPLLGKNGFSLVKHAKFQLGLNNLFVFQKTSSA
jgi:2-polyprenyl-3-methyl-5-hydroxy-6-metoxy-1,4-benzoquinol methylase